MTETRCLAVTHILNASRFCLQSGPERRQSPGRDRSQEAAWSPKRRIPSGHGSGPTRLFEAVLLAAPAHLLPRFDRLRQCVRRVPVGF